MKFAAILAVVTLTVFINMSAFAASPRSPYGYWLTENQRSVIKVEPCRNNNQLACGHIHWITKGGLQTDVKNPDESRRDAPMCGLQLMRGFKQQDAANWIDGKIYKADEGDTYNATLQLLPTGKMIVRGYVVMPLFGKSQTWSPVSEKDYPRCKPAR